MLFNNTQSDNLGLLTYVIITLSLFVFWIILWKWHKKTKKEIAETRKNLYRRWSDENKLMNKVLNKEQKEEIEETQIVK